MSKSKQPRIILGVTGGIAAYKSPELVRRLRDEGKTVLFSSHVMQEVSALCDHIVVIALGKIVASGTPDELRQTTGQANLEDAFVTVIGSEEGLQR